MDDNLSTNSWAIMVNKKLLTFYLFMFIRCLVIQAQVFDTVPMRQVIGTTGGTGVFPWGTVDYTVGEVIVTTDSATAPYSTIKWLTQGFQQPHKNDLSVKVIGVNSTCIGANNGSVNVYVYNSTGVAKCSWNGSTPTTTYLYTNLSPGTYTYSVQDTNFTVSGSIQIFEDHVDCGQELHIYNGITANADGHNDKWEIDGITNFHTNVVSIYNRWGDLVWTIKNYNNETPSVWEGNNQSGVRLPDGTYFYIIEAGGKVYKGWVELSH